MTQPHWKQPVYILLTMILWAMIGCVVAIFLALNANQDIVVSRVAILGVSGAMAGFFIGRIWYFLIYVQGNRWHRLPPH